VWPSHIGRGCYQADHPVSLLPNLIDDLIGVADLGEGRSTLGIPSPTLKWIESRVVDLLEQEYNEVKNDFGGSNLVKAAAPRLADGSPAP
jgi:hypothetical protein